MGRTRLTRKELVEHIRQTMPRDYNEYEKLAFIELEVAKQISFDVKYLKKLPIYSIIYNEFIKKENIYV